MNTTQNIPFHLNSRTSTDRDFFNFDDRDPSNTLSDFVENSVNILDILRIPRVRENKDLFRNRYGVLLLDFCKGNNFFILNGRLDGNKYGNYTCKNVSVVGYCICNASFVNRFLTLNVPLVSL